MRHNLVQLNQHLLFSGYYNATAVQSRLSLAPLRKTLVSLEPLALAEPKIYHASSGAGHSLLGIQNETGTRILGLGRNEMGQLGLNLCSQKEEHGLVNMAAGSTLLGIWANIHSSFLLIQNSQRSKNLYGFGSLQRGRLGLVHLHSTAETMENEEPVLHRQLSPSLVTLDSAVEEVAVGYEHALFLTANGDVFATGCNTDGQLGLGITEDQYTPVKLPLSEDILTQGVQSIHAGADTSALITKQGQLYVWGNAEYAQSFHQQKIDQIVSPLPVVFRSDVGKIVDFQCGGSFSLVLDEHGNVFSTGFGALGLGKNTISTNEICRIPLDDRVCMIRAGWGSAVAVTQSHEKSKERYSLYSWGLNNRYGKLGIGSSDLYENVSNSQVEGNMVYKPVKLSIPYLEGAVWDSVEDISIGEDTIWVVLNTRN